MKDGRIYSEGPPDEIIEAGRLSHLYDTPVQVAEVDGRSVCLFYEAAAGAQSPR